MRGTLLLLVITLICLGGPNEGKGDDQQQEESKIPTTLAEAHAELERILPPQTLAEIDAMPSEEGMAKYHMGFGADVRGRWLRYDSPLAQHMRRLGFSLPNSMSGVILATFWCKRHGQDFRLEERAAAEKKFIEAMGKANEEVEDRNNKTIATASRMMMGLRFKEREVPIVRMPDRGWDYVRARFLSSFRRGVLITTTTRAFYFDVADQKIHPIQVAEVNSIESAVVVDKRAWLAGMAGTTPFLVGVNGQDRIALPLPQEGNAPKLGRDDNSLLAVYPQTIFRLTDRKWTLIYSGDIQLPRSGLPPRLQGDMVVFRDEGIHGNSKRLWLLTLGDEPRLTSFDRDSGLAEPLILRNPLNPADMSLYSSGYPGWGNSFSFSITRSGDLWACLGTNLTRKSLLRRSRDGSYSIAILNNSVRFTADIWGSNETDQGLSVSGVAALPDDTLLVVGDTGLYRLKGKELVQELAFTNTQQEIVNESGDHVLHWKWIPSNVLVLDDNSYLISGTFGGVYLLSKAKDGRWSFLSLDEELGDPVVW